MSSNTKALKPYSFLYFFILVGLLLRIVGLFFFPPGMEGDEVAVIYWGRQWIQSGQFILISADEMSAWETPVAYFFGGLDLLGVSPRVGAVALSFVEIGMCYLWAKRRGGELVGLTAAAFLAMIPWHFFFSYVLGPCVAGLWTSLYLLDVKNLLGRAAINVGGIFYYASFRVVLAWGGLKNLLRRNFRDFVVDVASGILAVGILFLMGIEHLKGFFDKGSYLVDKRGLIEWLHHYLNALVLWWTPPLQVFWKGLSQYSMDDVGFGFANILGFQTPLSVGISVFFAWGLYVCFKSKNRDLVYLFALAILLVGFSPSFVHFPFILPVVAFIAAMGAMQYVERSGSWRWVRVALFIGFVAQVVMILNFHRNDRWQTFTGLSEKIPGVVKQQTGSEKFIWISGYDYYKDRLVADRHKLELYAFETQLYPWLDKIRQSLKDENTRWIFIHTRVADEHPRPEVLKLIQDLRVDLENRSRYIELNLQIASKKDVVVDGQKIGILYEVDR